MQLAKNDFGSVFGSVLQKNSHFGVVSFFFRLGLHTPSLTPSLPCFLKKFHTADLELHLSVDAIFRLHLYGMMLEMMYFCAELV